LKALQRDVPFVTPPPPTTMDGKFLLRGAQTFSLKEPPNFENFKWSFQRCCQNVNPLDFFLQGMPKKIGGSDSWMFKGRGGGGRLKKERTSRD